MFTEAQIQASRERRDRNHQASCLYKTRPYDRRRLVDAVTDAYDFIDKAIYWTSESLMAHGPEDNRQSRESFAYDVLRHNHRLQNYSGV